ncbi:hypothetical protein BD560DRAFT_380034 [Blakeslea trispora]|nr:hypothetical protein BD560DRAFT_380034 [Blakeslea trispora]
MRLSILSTVGCVILTPFVLLVMLCLMLLAVITTTFTSSFLFLRFTLLAIEVVSGLTLESTNWLLTHCMLRIEGYLNRYRKQQHTPNKTIVMRRKKLSTSSLTLSQLPFKAKIKSTYSVSVPGTPDPELFRP